MLSHRGYGSILPRGGDMHLWCISLWLLRATTITADGDVDAADATVCHSIGDGYKQCDHERPSRAPTNAL